MIIDTQILVLLFIIFVLLITAHTSTPCNRSCGYETATHLPFPFGFSENCEIRLNCSGNGDIRIGEFRVQNVTPDSLSINIPANCNRSIRSLEQLFSWNYAVGWQNELLLQNCISPLSGCVLPMTLVQNHMEVKGCDPKSDHINCLSEETKGRDFMNFTDLNQSNCQNIFSSVAIDSKNKSRISFEFQTLQLEWWLVGSCNCSRDANCTPVISRRGYRCQCKEGFEGDGFSDGVGCRKVSSKCNLSKYMDGHCGGTTRVGVLFGGIIAGASLMAGLALLCYFIWRCFSSLKTRKSSNLLLSKAAGSYSIPFYSYKEIEKATNGFSEKERLGTGAYGAVYAGKLHNDEWVAIKKIRHRDTDGIEQVMNEIKLLSSVSHPNLVRLLGCCIESGEQILIYEFMPNGTLSQHLQRERGNGLPWTIRLAIATETAQAIAHLHSAMAVPIYHRDIKSSNILLDHNFNSKVADFGLSRLGMTESSHISTAPQGTPGYLDPQYHQNFHLSDKSDVYSFGVVLVEIITALKVVDFSRPHSEVNLAALAVDKIGKGCMDEIMDPFLEPHRDAWTLSSVHKVAELAFRCLAFHKDMRPSMMEVAAELEQIKISAWVPLEENLCLASSAASSCSSPSNRSEKSVGGTVKKARVGSRRLVVQQKGVDRMISMVEVKDSSPISVHDPWLSEQSSPSTNSLLGNVIQ